MMEKSDLGEGHHHAILIAGGDDVIITDGTARFSNIGDTGTVGPFDVVTEGEESVAA